MNDPERERMIELRKKFLSESRTPLNYGTFPDPRQSEREWWVVSTTLAEVWLMLSCVNTGAHGVVKDPSSEEWRMAFSAPSEPYQWHDNSRVTLMHEVE